MPNLNGMDQQEFAQALVAQARSEGVECNLSNYMAHFVRFMWPGQTPTTRTSRAASMASGVMVSKLLMVMMRATWLTGAPSLGERLQMNR